MSEVSIGVSSVTDSRTCPSTSSRSIVADAACVFFGVVRNETRTGDPAALPPFGLSSATVARSTTNSPAFAAPGRLA